MREIRAAWVYLTALFLCSMLAPFMDMALSDKVLLQFAMVLFGCLVSVSFIYDLIRLSDYRVLVPFYASNESVRIQRLLERETGRLQIERDRSRESFFRSGPLAAEVPDEASKMTKEVAEDFLLLINSAIEKNRLRELYIAFNGLSSMTQSYYKGSKQFWIQQDEYTMYLISELKKIVNSCANPTREKFLDSLSPPLEKMILSACCLEVNMNATNDLIRVWLGFLTETVYWTGESDGVANSSYPPWAITTIGNLGINGLISGHIQTVSYGPVRELSEVVGRLAKKGTPWSDFLIQRANRSLCEVFSYYCKCWIQYKWDNEFFVQRWEKSATNSLVTVLRNYKSGFMALDLLAPFLEDGLLSINLPRAYTENMGRLASVTVEDFGNELKEIEEGTDRRIWATSLMRRKRTELLCVHKIINILLDRKLVSHSQWKNVGLTVSTLFYVDSLSCCDSLGVSEQWKDKAQHAYSSFFKNIENIYTKEINEPDNYTREFIANTLAIPAFALVLRGKENIQFADAVMNAYCEMYLNILQKVVKDEPNRERMWWSYGLLLAAWLNLFTELSELRERLESILKKNRPVSRSSEFASTNMNLGYPPEIHRLSGFWRLPPTYYWNRETQDKVSTQLMEPNRLKEYAEKLFETVEGTPDE